MTDKHYMKKLQNRILLHFITSFLAVKRTKIAPPQKKVKCSHM